MLLHFLKESSNSNSNSNVSTSPMRSAAILQYQSVAHSAVGSEVEGRVKSGDTESYGDENGDGVDEDILADSDEEDGEKDLDWHLGRLTRRQSVLSQWSRSLSSTAAIYCGPKREGAAGTRSSQSTKQTVRPDPTLTSRRVPTTAPARKTVSATNKAHVPIHIPSSPPNSTLRHKKSPEKLSINSKNNERIVPRSPTLMRVRLGDERVGLRSSSNTPRKVTVGVPNDTIIEGNSNISIVGDQRPGFEESIPHEEGSMSVYPELCEFTNFSNITMILDNAKVLMQGNEERDIMHDKALNSNIGKRSLLNSMGGGGASSRSGSRKLVSSHAPMTGSHASSTQNGLLSASASARTGAGAGGMQAGQVTGLFAAVMKDQNSTSTRC